MSRIANNPITIPSGVEVNISGDIVTIKGSKGELTHNIHPLIKLEQSDDVIKTLVKNNSKFAKWFYDRRGPSFRPRPKSFHR